MKTFYFKTWSQNSSFNELPWESPRGIELISSLKFRSKLRGIKPIVWDKKLTLFFVNMNLPITYIKKLLFISSVALTLSYPGLSFSEVRKEYYPGGELRAERNFVNGRVKYIYIFKNGKRTNSKRYDEEGKLKSDQDYPQ